MKLLYFSPFHNALYELTHNMKVLLVKSSSSQVKRRFTAINDREYLYLIEN
jgi:hypothetical protein